MDLSGEAARAKHQPRLPANDREEISSVQTFHHQAGPSVDYHFLVDLRDGHAGGTGGLECRDLERQPRARPGRTQQLQDAAVRTFEDLSFPTLADQPKAAR